MENYENDCQYCSRLFKFVHIQRECIRCADLRLNNVKYHQGAAKESDVFQMQLEKEQALTRAKSLEESLKKVQDDSEDTRQLKEVLKKRLGTSWYI